MACRCGAPGRIARLNTASSRAEPLPPRWVSCFVQCKAREGGCHDNIHVSKVLTG